MWLADGNYQCATKQLWPRNNSWHKLETKWADWSILGGFFLLFPNLKLIYYLTADSSGRVMQSVWSSWLVEFNPGGLSRIRVVKRLGWCHFTLGGDVLFTLLRRIIFLIGGPMLGWSLGVWLRCHQTEWVLGTGVGGGLWWLVAWWWDDPILLISCCPIGSMSWGVWLSFDELLHICCLEHP